MALGQTKLKFMWQAFKNVSSGTSRGLIAFGNESAWFRDELGAGGNGWAVDLPTVFDLCVTMSPNESCIERDATRWFAVCRWVIAAADWKTDKQHPGIRPACVRMEEASAIFGWPNYYLLFLVRAAQLKPLGKPAQNARK
jgi:hypothetical protein